MCDTYNSSSIYSRVYLHSYDFMIGYYLIERKEMIIMSLNDFNKKYNLQNKTTSNFEILQVLSSLSLNDVAIYLREGPFESDTGVVNLHSSKGTHWVCYIIENYFDSYGCVCPKKRCIFIIKRNGHCLYSENHFQKNDSFCVSSCLYILYLTKVIGIDFKPAVLNLYYQRFSVILKGIEKNNT